MAGTTWLAPSETIVGDGLGDARRPLEGSNGKTNIFRCLLTFWPDLEYFQ
jgi:hypothetical protein